MNITVANENDIGYIESIRDSVDNYLTGLFIGGVDRQRVWWDRVKSSDTTIVYVVRDKCTNVGYAMLDKIDRHNRTCYGQVQIEEKYRGKGHGTNAWWLILDVAFNTLGMNKVILEVLTDNERAISVYRRLGFTIEGTLRSHYWKNGEYVDAYIMGLLREEYYHNERVYV